MGEGSANTAGIIAATLIGGSINFVTTAEILNFSSNPLFTATLAIDNFAANIYVLLLFLVPSVGFLARFFRKTSDDEQPELLAKEEQKHAITLERFAVSIFIALLVAGAGTIVSPFFQQLFQTELNLSILEKTTKVSTR